MMSAVAGALGLQEAGATSLSALVHGYLRQREVLLTLDNLEHLPAASAEVAALLEACPRVKVLATSRVLLHLVGEHELKVPLLAVPVAEDAGDVAASPAVALFAERAAALGRDVLSADDWRAAAQICRRLDGLPLAIELAAARLRALTPAALADRLQHSLPILKGGAADAPQRQQTLRHTIAWSHDLLDASARLLFRRGGEELAAIREGHRVLRRHVDGPGAQSLGTREPAQLCTASRRARSSGTMGVRAIRRARRHRPAATSTRALRSRPDCASPGVNAQLE